MSIDTRKEATLAVIDAALDYLERSTSDLHDILIDEHETVRLVKHNPKEEVAL